jgi:sugar/nucleoside kinase (ribokinase family)
MTNNTLDVVGIGNAIVDVLAQVDDDFLRRHALTKGSMALIDERQAGALYEDMPAGIECSGGSAANTMAGIAMLGGRAGFIGKVRDDLLGAVFAHDIRAAGVRFDTPLATGGAATARCLIAVTPDAQRTMSTYLGACVGLHSHDIDETAIAAADITYLEGYLWDPPAAKAAFRRAVAISHKAGRMVALSLSDSFCVQRWRDEFLDLVEKDVDILFANEAELLALYQADTFDAALQKVRGKVQIAALTRSEKGSVIVSGDEVHVIDATTTGPVIDTTGAGDLYAAGFLYGMSQGRDLGTCGRIGSLCAGAVIAQIGARPGVSLRTLVASRIK